MAMTRYAGQLIETARAANRSIQPTAAAARRAAQPRDPTRHAAAFFPGA